jgi:hypothetical protein
MGGKMGSRIGRHVGVVQDAGKFIASVVLDTRLPPDVRQRALRIWEAGTGGEVPTFEWSDLDQPWNVQPDGRVFDGVTLVD